MAKKRAIPPSQKPLLPEVGEIFVMPLEDGRFGACRVIQRSAFDGPSVLVAASPWIGNDLPDLEDPRLRSILILSHHSFNNEPAMVWVDNPLPKAFKRLGVIEPSAREKRIKVAGGGAWAFFPIHLQMQSRWDSDREAVLRDELPKTVDDETAVGRFVLHRFNGDEEFRLRSADILAVHDQGGIRLWFEAETDGVPVKSLPDTADLGGHPKAEIAVTLKKLNPKRLPGRRFSVPSGYDQASEDYVATIYYVEHECLNNNNIEILDREDNVFQVRWSGTTTDVNYYDGSKPETKVEIEGKFTFKYMSEWVRT